jgi:hypothetical protein
MAFDVSWVELDLRREHKIPVISKRGGAARSDRLTNGATARRLAGGRGLFGNRVVRGQRRPLGSAQRCGMTGSGTRRDEARGPSG